MKKRKYNYLGMYCFLFLIYILFIYFTFVYAPKLKEVKEVDNYLVNMKTNTPKKEAENDYIAVLEIPSLELKKGLYDLNSKLNTVSKNIQVISGSTWPDDPYSCLILAAHSGDSSISYFKHLYRLSMNSVAFLYYNNKKYTYMFVNHYQETKDGTITIHREELQSHLILVTCDQKNKELQNIYVFKLLEENN